MLFKRLCHRESLQQESTRDVMPQCPEMPVATWPCAFHLLKRTHQQLAMTIQSSIMSVPQLDSTKLQAASAQQQGHQTPVILAASVADQLEFVCLLAGIVWMLIQHAKCSCAGVACLRSGLDNFCKLSRN